MRSGNTRVFVVLALLALGGSWLLPSVSGAGKENSLVQRVQALEDEVAALIARVEALEGGSCSCVCDVLHLEPLADFPESPSEGDVCVVGESESRHIYSYLDGDWWQVDPSRGGGFPPRP